MIVVLEILSYELWGIIKYSPNFCVEYLRLNDLIVQYFDKVNNAQITLQINITCSIAYLTAISYISETLFECYLDERALTYKPSIRFIFI